MDWFSSNDGQLRINKYETIKKKFIEEGEDEKTAEYKAKEIAYPPQKLEKVTLNPTKEQESVTFYFKNKEDFNLVSKHFKLNEYMGYNTHHVELLIKLLKAHEEN